MIRLGRERSSLGVVADQVGTPTYARDLPLAIMTIVEKGIIPGVYHFTDEGVASWYDFAKAIHRLSGITGCDVKPLHTEDYPTPATRPHFSILDKTKIKQTYDIVIPHWEESLEECIRCLVHSS
jgi:dTDP-4-dehydrorhamnose reductase